MGCACWKAVRDRAVDAALGFEGFGFAKAGLVLLLHQSNRLVLSLIKRGIAMVLIRKKSEADCHAQGQ